MEDIELMAQQIDSDFRSLLSFLRTTNGITLRLELEYTTFFGDTLNLGFCDCRHFSKDLKNLFKELVSERSDSFKWNTFENFIRKHGWNNRSLFSVDGAVASKYCSIKICSVLMNRVESLLRCGIELPIMLKTVMENFQTISNCVTESLQENLRRSESREAIGILTALRDHSNFINLLLNFGIISSTKDYSSGFDVKIYIIISSFMKMWIDITSSCLKAMEAVNLTKKALIFANNEETTKRMFLASVAIRATQLSFKTKNDLAKDFVHYLKAYFAATTDPFLTIFEVRSLLYACLSVVKKPHLFNMYSQQFDKLMPECPMKIEPRRLNDLARCQVRQNLKNCNLPLPSAVEQLRLPDTLKSFVLGNIIDNSISRKRRCNLSQEEPTKAKLARWFLE